MKFSLTLLSSLLCLSVLSQEIKNTFWDVDAPHFSLSIVELPDGEFAGARVVIKGKEGFRGVFPAHTYKGTDGWVTIDYGYGRPDRLIQFKVISRDSNAMVCQLDMDSTGIPLMKKNQGFSFTLHKRPK